jgi:uncharacterized membrane protein
MILEEKGDSFYGALTYSFGWLTAIYFLSVKRRAIRWHALQSIVVFGGLMLGIIAADSIFPLDTRNSLFYLLHIVSIGGLIIISIGLWILLPLQTFRGKPFLVPVFAPLTLKLAGVPPWTLPTEPWEHAPASSGGPVPNAAWDDSSGSSNSMPCAACGGSGQVTCSSCGGRGSWYEQPTTATGNAQLQNCGACISSGRLRCVSCGGTGRAQALI